MVLLYKPLTVYIQVANVTADSNVGKELDGLLDIYQDK